jgi:hypothetical protein
LLDIDEAVRGFGPATLLTVLRCTEMKKVAIKKWFGQKKARTRHILAEAPRSAFHRMHRAAPTGASGTWSVMGKFAVFGQHKSVAKTAARLPYAGRFAMIKFAP